MRWIMVLIILPLVFQQASAPPPPLLAIANIPTDERYYEVVNLFTGERTQVTRSGTLPSRITYGSESPPPEEVFVTSPLDEQVRFRLYYVPITEGMERPDIYDMARVLPDGEEIFIAHAVWNSPLYFTRNAVYVGVKPVQTPRSSLTYSLQRVDLATNEVTPVLDQVLSLFACDDRRCLLSQVTYADENTWVHRLYFLDLDDSRLEELFQVENAYIQTWWDERVLGVPDGDAITLYHYDDTTERFVSITTLTDIDIEGLEWSPDGDRLLLVSRLPEPRWTGDLYLIDPATGDLLRVTEKPIQYITVMPFGVEWIPGGLLYDAEIDERTLLLRYAFADGETQVLQDFTGPGGVSDTLLSPDGEWLATVRTVDGELTLYTLATDGSGEAYSVPLEDYEYPVCVLGWVRTDEEMPRCSYHFGMG